MHDLPLDLKFLPILLQLPDVRTESCAVATIAVSKIATVLVISLLKTIASEPSVMLCSVW